MEKTRGRTLSELRSEARIDRIKVATTTHDDMHRHMVEDGLDPENPLRGFRPLIEAVAVRRKTGLSQDGFAKAIGVPVKTIQNWEQGRSTPDAAVQALLRLVDNDPDRSLSVLSNVDPAKAVS